MRCFFCIRLNFKPRLFAAVVLGNITRHFAFRPLITIITPNNFENISDIYITDFENAFKMKGKKNDDQKGAKKSNSHQAKTTLKTSLLHCCAGRNDDDDHDDNGNQSVWQPTNWLKCHKTMHNICDENWTSHQKCIDEAIWKRIKLNYRSFGRCVHSFFSTMLTLSPSLSPARCSLNI